MKKKDTHTKTLTAEISSRVRIDQFIQKLTLDGWKYLLTGTNFQGPKPVRDIEVLLYIFIELRNEKIIPKLSVTS